MAQLHGAILGFKHDWQMKLGITTVQEKTITQFVVESVAKYSQENKGLPKKEDHKYNLNTFCSKRVYEVVFTKEQRIFGTR